FSTGFPCEGSARPGTITGLFWSESFRETNPCRAPSTPGAALQFVVTEFFTNVSRPQVLVLVTSGSSSLSEVLSASQELRRRRVRSYAVAEHPQQENRVQAGDNTGTQSCGQSSLESLCSKSRREVKQNQKEDPKQEKWAQASESNTGRTQSCGSSSPESLCSGSVLGHRSERSPTSCSRKDKHPVAWLPRCMKTVRVESRCGAGVNQGYAGWLDGAKNRAEGLAYERSRRRFRGADRSELRMISSHPSHVFYVPSSESLQTIRDPLLTALCSSSDSGCNSTSQADLVFLVDGSWSIGRINFKIIRSFISGVISGFDVGPERVQIGLVQFSGDPRLEWNLNSHLNKTSVMQAVDNLPYKGGNTLTGLALNFLLENSFCPNVGLRPNSQRIAVLINDGGSLDHVQVHAQNMRDSGIELVKSAEEEELRSIASDPDHSHMFMVKDFMFLQDIQNDLITNLCHSVNGLGLGRPGASGPTGEKKLRVFP
ncbi:hypothetical protein WMY93_034354, partial [Mugilogobius chulae]